VADETVPQEGPPIGTWAVDKRTGKQVFFPDYCVALKHVAFEGSRTCYCGAFYFMETT